MHKRSDERNLSNTWTQIFTEKPVITANAVQDSGHDVWLPLIASITKTQNPTSVIICRVVLQHTLDNVRPDLLACTCTY